VVRVPSINHKWNSRFRMIVATHAPESPQAPVDRPSMPSRIRPLFLPLKNI
jgi:hypothetical protein